MRVLLVEDQMMLARAVTRWLSRGETMRVVEHAADVAAGLRALEAGKYDVVITDWNLGDNRKGGEIIEAARAKGVPVYVLSSDVPEPEYRSIWVNKSDLTKLLSLVAVLERTPQPVRQPSGGESMRTSNDEPCEAHGTRNCGSSMCWIFGPEELES